LESKIEEIKALYAKLGEKRVERVQFAASIHQIQRESGGEGPRIGAARRGLVFVETSVQGIEARIEALEVELLRAYLADSYMLEDEVLAQRGV